MRYAVLNGGKRIRPMLVYAAGECLSVPAVKLDAPATAVELIHAFSLVHDDLPAMDDDDLRRGAPTVHKKFDEATAILAADALQPLAFATVATHPDLSDAQKTKLIALIAAACGSTGMTGGQSIDLAAEGKLLSGDEIRQMHELKTAALIRAAVMSACCLSEDLDSERRDALDRFSASIGLAFQIRDDILDVEGVTEVLGKKAGADESRQKATWPSVFGLGPSREKCAALLQQGLAAVEIFDERADALRYLASVIVERKL
jgi:farnesyl diphosphate synthase